jgi:hypothetical protein
MAWTGIQIRALSSRRISARDSGISSPIGTGRLQGPLSVAGPPPSSGPEDVVVVFGLVQGQALSASVVGRGQGGAPGGTNDLDRGAWPAQSRAPVKDRGWSGHDDHLLVRGGGESGPGVRGRPALSRCTKTQVVFGDVMIDWGVPVEGVRPLSLLRPCRHHGCGGGGRAGAGRVASVGGQMRAPQVGPSAVLRRERRPRHRGRAGCGAPSG